MPAHFKERLAALTRSLRSREFAGLVLFAPGSGAGPASASQGTMRFLADWDSASAPSLLVLRPDREPVILVTSPLTLLQAREHFVVEDIRFAPGAEVGAMAASLLRETTGETRKAAILNRAEMPLGIWEPLVAGLPALAWRDLTGEIDAERVIKSPDQIERHEGAAMICDAMFETLRLALRVPRPATQLQADMERTARYAGCEYVSTWLTVRPEADHPRSLKAECLRVPQAGDQILAGVTIQIDGIWGHAVRTGSIGEPKAAHRRVHAIAMEMQNAMAMALKPGQDLYDVRSAADRVLDEYLTPEQRARAFRLPDAQSLGFSLGDPVASQPFLHGSGAEGDERPLPLPVMPGMLFGLHPNLFVPELGGACIGDMVVVTPQHCRALTNVSRDLEDWTA